MKPRTSRTWSTIKPQTNRKPSKLSFSSSKASTVQRHFFQPGSAIGATDVASRTWGAKRRSFRGRLGRQRTLRLNSIAFQKEEFIQHFWRLHVYISWMFAGDCPELQPIWVFASFCFWPPSSCRRSPWGLHWAAIDILVDLRAADRGDRGAELAELAELEPRPKLKCHRCRGSRRVSIGRAQRNCLELRSLQLHEELPPEVVFGRAASDFKELFQWARYASTCAQNMRKPQTPSTSSRDLFLVAKHIWVFDKRIATRHSLVFIERCLPVWWTQQVKSYASLV